MFISYKTKFNDKNLVLFLRDEALNLINPFRAASRWQQVVGGGALCCVPTRLECAENNAVLKKIIAFMKCFSKFPRRRL